MRHWLIKFAPFRTSWNEIVRTGRFTLRGVRSAEARNHLAKMEVGDSVLFYHSQEQKVVVGLMEVQRCAYPDSTSTDARWLTADFRPVHELARPVPLALIKGNPALQHTGLVRQPRLAVMPLTEREFAAIVAFGVAS